MTTIPSVTTSRQTALINLPSITLWKLIRPCTFEWQKSLVAKTDIIGSSRLIHYLDKTQQTIQVTEVSDKDKRISWSMVSSEPSVTFTSRDDTICLTEITAPNGFKHQTLMEWKSEFSNDATTEVIVDGNLKKCDAFSDLADNNLSKLAFVNLKVCETQWPKVKKFYQSCGMKSNELDTNVTQLQWDPKNDESKLQLQSCGIEFIHNTIITKEYSSTGKTDVYWKIGFGLHDVNNAAKKCSHYLDQTVKPGNQFLDVGFLTHLCDPAGFTIELLQTTFENNEKDRKILWERSKINSNSISSSPLGNGIETPTIGQITIRASDIKKTLNFYQNELGMKLLCIEPITQYKFELYFLGFTHDNPPNPNDLTAVENREWLYQRPYTTLEIQVRLAEKSGPMTGTDLAEDQSGFDGITILANKKLFNKFGGKKKDVVIKDPNGIKIFIRNSMH